MFLATFITVGFLVNSIIVVEEVTRLKTVICIDLGTTYSYVGVYKNGHVETIANNEGNMMTRRKKSKSYEEEGILLLALHDFNIQVYQG
jgi:hypothetical protein